MAKTLSSILLTTAAPALIITFLPILIPLIIEEPIPITLFSPTSTSPANLAPGQMWTPSWIIDPWSTLHAVLIMTPNPISTSDCITD